MSNREALTWVEVSQKALAYNVGFLRSLISKTVVMAPCVKANAYGHGLIETATIALQSGADWVAVNSLTEAISLREAGVNTPLYILGYVLQSQLSEAIRLDCRLVVYSKETIKNLAAAAAQLKKKARVHIKVETGNNRQGMRLSELIDLVEFARKFPEIEIEGIATHFANIEDVEIPSAGQGVGGFAKVQLDRFKEALHMLEEKGIKIPLQHCSNSAATLIFPETHFTMVRPGIAMYGLWPSPEIEKAVKKKMPSVELMPVLSWKTRIAQIKKVAQGESVGYGCTYTARKNMRLAILPVGYYDGYDRGFSNKAHVLIHGKKAPVCGRICMNIFMVDVTDIPETRVEDEVTLLGRDGAENISAEYLAELIGTINYEITTRINDKIPRIITN